MFRARPLPSFDDVFRPDKAKSSKVRSSASKQGFAGVGPRKQAGICRCTP